MSVSELDEEALESISDLEELADPYLHSRIWKAGYGGFVETIERATISKSVLHRVRYDDGDIEHLELQEVIDFQVPRLVLTCRLASCVKGHIRVTCTSMSGIVLARVEGTNITLVGALRQAVAGMIEAKESLRVQLVSEDGHLMADEDTVISCLKPK